MRGIVYLKLEWGEGKSRAMVSMRLPALPPAPSRLREGEQNQRQKAARPDGRRLHAFKHSQGAAVGAPMRIT